VSRAVWDELVATALVGTARRPLPKAVARHLEPVIGSGGNPPDLVTGSGNGAGSGAARGADSGGGGGAGSGSAEAAVLVAAAVMGAERRVGVRTRTTEVALPDPAPPEVRPEAGPGAVQLLELLLGGAAGLGRAGGPGATGASTALAVEWLDRVAATGRIVPRRLLPALLDLATRTPDLRVGLIAAGGTTAPWLAARNPAWSWAVAASDAPGAAATWRTGPGEARFAALAAVRTADPDAGRALLEETWAGEKAADRAAAVRTLRTGLGPDDEPFLEAALDDRAASVRTAAAEILTRLSGSARAGRMADRLRPLVAVSGRLRRSLAVELPDEPDAAARRDGIGDTGRPPATGRRAWWLTQIVAGTPLAFWTDGLGLSPGATADLVQGHPEVLAGLTAAVVTQADPTWAAALAGHHPTPELLALLPPPAAIDLVTRALRRAEDAAVPRLLAAAPGPWPAPFTIAVVGRLRGLQNTIALQSALGVVAGRGHPDAGAALEEWIGDLADAETRRRLVRPVAHTLSIRRAITQELP
jgi:hypothetical protein